MATIPASAALPADRLGKVPGRLVLGVVLDDHVLDAAQAADGALALAEQDAERQRVRALDAARLDRSGTSEDVQQAIAALLEQVEADTQAAVAAARETSDAANAALEVGTRWFTFRTIGRKAYRDLIAAHPPTDVDHELAQAVGQDRATFNGETFPRALVQAAAADPVLSAEDIAAVFDGDSWSDGDIEALFRTALAAQLQSRTVTRGQS